MERYEFVSTLSEQSAAVSPPIDQPAWHYLKEINSTPDRLNRIALTDGVKQYSFAEMFAQWKRYAAVFSALGITRSNRSRVGLMGSTSAEAVFALYGLNMVGAETSVIAVFSIFSLHKIIQTVQQEHLTDLILTDDFLQPDVFAALLHQKERLGLRNILYLHIPIGGKSIDRGLSYMQEQKYVGLWNWIAPYTMDQLMAQHENYPVDVMDQGSSDTSFILHTSGTTSGTGKPIPLSDKTLNFSGRSYHHLPGLEEMTRNAVCGLTVDLSNAYGLVNQLHAPLALNASVALVPGAAFNPLYHKSIPALGINVLFCTSAQLEMWMHLLPVPKFDFSCLRAVIIGGSSVSVKDKLRYHEFLTRHGAGDLLLINGYGLSETGGACILSTPDLHDEAIGYPLPGIEVCLCDEDTGAFLTRENAPCTGVMYLRSEAMTCGCLDGDVKIPLEPVFGTEYICTNDLVSMDAAGKITFLGRANRYFLNQSGMKYESGKVETAVSKQEGIESCGIVPVYFKAAHDNIPMLCVKPLAADDTAQDVVCKALLNVFTGEGCLSRNNLPLRVLIADSIPRNPNGKIDISKISRGEVTGKRYALEVLTENDSITGFRLTPVKDDHEDVIRQAAKNITNDIRIGCFDGRCLYNTNQKEDHSMFQFNNAQRFFGGMNQMGNQWMNMMNWTNQMNQMVQMNQMMAAYANQMFLLSQQTAQAMHKQNMELLQKINEMMQANLSNSPAATASVTENN